MIVVLSAITNVLYTVTNVCCRKRSNPNSVVDNPIAKSNPNN